MRGSVLITFNEFVENRGNETVTVTVNNQIRKIIPNDTTKQYSTFINLGDVVNIKITENPLYTGSTKEIDVNRIDYTTDDSGGDFGIKNTLISATSGTTGNFNVTFTATTRADAYSFQYLVDVSTCNTPTLTSSLTPAATCSTSTFNYTPTLSIEGATYLWTRNTVSGISNPATTGTTAISETLINTTNAPISVPYVFNLSAVPGCFNTQTVTEVINPKPFVGNYNISFCSEATVTITISNGGGDIVPVGTTYTWTVGSNSNLTGQSNQPIPQTGLTISLSNNTIVQQSIDYIITPTSPQGCVGDPFVFTMLVNPRLTNPQTSGTIFNNQTINMTPVMTGSTLVPSGTTYTWTYTPLTGVTGMTTQTLPATGITQTLTNTTNTRKFITYQITGTTGTCTRAYTYTVELFADPIVVGLGNPAVTSWTAPVNITSAYVECIGAGGRGGNAQVADFVSYGRSRGGGGGGGAYAASQLSIIGGTTYSIQVGRRNASSTTAGDDGNTWFDNPSIIFAEAGLRGFSSSDGIGARLGLGAGQRGGLASNSIGTIKRNGGAGDAADLTGAPAWSGAGGGRGGAIANGGAGDNPNGGYGQGFFGGGGQGGDSVSGTRSGRAGTGNGSGGSGGSCALNTATGQGGESVEGVIILTYYLL